MKICKSCFSEINERAKKCPDFIMKCLPLMVFLITFLLVPSVCHSFSVPSFEETVSHCKAFIDSCDAPRNNIESLRAEELVGPYMMCSQSAILAKLSPHEKSVLESISGKVENLKHELPPEHIEQMEHFYGYYNTKWEGGYKESYTDQEITEFDAKMRTLWQEMVQALSEGDIEKVAGCFHEQSRASYRMRFKNISSEGRKKMADELATAFIELEEIRGDAAVYLLVPEREGEKYLFQLTFLRNMTGEWKILSY